MCVHAKSLQLCPTLCNPMDCSLPGPSVHRSLQGRILKWAAMPLSRGSSRPRDGIPVFYVSCIGRRVLYHFGFQMVGWLCDSILPAMHWELEYDTAKVMHMLKLYFWLNLTFYNINWISSPSKLWWEKQRSSRPDVKYDNYEYQKDINDTPWEKRKFRMDEQWGTKH